MRLNFKCLFKSLCNFVIEGIIWKIKIFEVAVINRIFQFRQSIIVKYDIVLTHVKLF